jgi:hypothetical protein
MNGPKKDNFKGSRRRLAAERIKPISKNLVGGRSLQLNIRGPCISDFQTFAEEEKDMLLV